MVLVQNNNLPCGGRDSGVQTHFPKFSVLGQSWRMRSQGLPEEGVTVSTVVLWLEHGTRGEKV